PAGLTAAGAPWTTGEARLGAPYRGLGESHATALPVRVPGPQARFGLVSDVDDTILLTGAQRVLEMVRQTFTGSALTRLPFAGAPELYRALAAEADEPDANPVFYVSSSPWNLHGFLLGFLRHRDFPVGPLLLRDLLGSGEARSHASHKAARIEEVLDLHPGLRFVLIGDSGQHDTEIYADVVRRHPGRILAAYIREVRLDPGDRRVESVLETWPAEVPVVLASDSAEVARHAASLGLVTETAAAHVAAATARDAR
ncbi:MAG: phosphatase domain-containing protein, partial [Nocardioidaceae bacterium]